MPAMEPYEELYKHFHRHPEISTLETKTSARIVEEVQQLDKKYDAHFDIKHPVGRTGLIAIHRNGPGSTILLRADIDGLPIKEKTGLSYASTDTQTDTHLDNQVKPTMHACGHDAHITCMLAAMDTLTSARALWSGTIVYLFQPAEERGCGARLMLDDGLYTKHGCPKPVVCLGQHVFPFRAGTVHTRAGPAMSAADSFKITIHGKGGHGSMPHFCVDPVVIAAGIVMKLQTLVSREVPPDETAVVTVGSLQAGQTVNVIADEATLLVNIRSVSTKWRQVLLDGMKRIVRAECEAGRCPQPPEILETNSFPLCDNDHTATAHIEETFSRFFGDRHLPNMKPVLGSEDFPLLGSEIGVPYVFWFWGGHDPDDWDQREKAGTLGEIAVNHSPFFAPVVQPTLRIGVEAMCIGALSYVGKT